MPRILAATMLCLSLALSLAACSGPSPTDQQTLVDRATLTLQEMAGADDKSDARTLLRLPRVC